MKTQDILKLTSEHLKSLSGHVFDLLTIGKPISADTAIETSKIVSKLSPLIGNLIEINTVEVLNKKVEFRPYGRWRRQDPGFPDAVFEGTVTPQPGLEIKAWFPLATEMTARFKDSQNRFTEDNTHVAVLAWMPEFLIYGKPYILDVCVVPGISVAAARDLHYHNPPDYLVMEPENTTQRTVNLQQTNTNGYKWQGTSTQFQTALKMVADWGNDGRTYKPTPEYQMKLRELMAQYPYRLDTNYAKIDRIMHSGIEEFKRTVHKRAVNGMTVKEWARVWASADQRYVKEILKKHIEIM
jgi:hypothetical protein